MTLFRAAIFGLLLALAAPTASTTQAQEDLLAPLAPAPTKKKKTRKPKKTPQSRRKNVEVDPLLSPLAPTQLVLNLRPEVKDAELFLDGRPVAKLPAPPLTVTPGEHRIEVRRPGYATAQRLVTLRDGQTTTIEIALEPNAGVVTVIADAPDAEVLIDDEVVGTSPLQGLLVEPGVHQLRVRRSGFRDETSRVLIKAGKDYSIRVFLKPAPVASNKPSDRPDRVDLTPNVSSVEPNPFEQPAATVSEDKSWHQRWYVWAGVGAVVAAGVAGAVVITQQNAGALPPNEVCRGPCDAVLNAPGIARF